VSSIGGGGRRMVARRGVEEVMKEGDNTLDYVSSLG